MKRFSVVLLAGSLSLCVCAFAQDGQATQAPPPSAHEHHMPSVDEQVAHLTSKLNLSQEQQNGVRSILQAQHEKMQALMQNSSGAPEEKHQQMKAMHESTKSQIRALLNDEQKKTFDEFAAQREQHMRQHEHGAHENGAPPPPEN